MKTLVRLHSGYEVEPHLHVVAWQPMMRDHVDAPPGAFQSHIQQPAEGLPHGARVWVHHDGKWLAGFVLHEPVHGRIRANFRLDPKTPARLEQLAKEHGLTTGQLLDQLAASFPQ